MASKSRRVASRQSQLTRHRKKQQRGPSGIPTEVPQPADALEQDDGETSEDTAATAVAESPPSGRPRPAAQAPTAQPATTPRSAARIRDERPAAYQYMGPEFRRIVAMAGTAFAVLVVLKLVL